eukprot:200734-Chlamydomonas_euryale.AAC.2
MAPSLVERDRATLSRSQADADNASGAKKAVRGRGSGKGSRSIGSGKGSCSNGSGKESRSNGSGKESRPGGRGKGSHAGGSHSSWAGRRVCKFMHRASLPLSHTPACKYAASHVTHASMPHRM